MIEAFCTPCQTTFNPDEDDVRTLPNGMQVAEHFDCGQDAPVLGEWKIP